MTEKDKAPPAPSAPPIPADEGKSEEPIAIELPIEENDPNAQPQ